MSYETLDKTRVVTNWQPSTLDAPTVEREFAELVQRLFGPEVWGRRKTYNFPETGFGVCTDTGVDIHTLHGTYPFWHQDCATHSKHQHLICWSNKIPTLVRYPDGTMLEAKDGDVIVIDNEEVEHSPPPNTNGQGRVFARVRIRKAI